MLDRPTMVVAVAKPHHGLGNRMRALLGCWSLAQLEQRELRYVWPVGRSFGARLSDLWTTPLRPMRAARERLLRAGRPYRGAMLDWVPASRDERTWFVRTAHALELPEAAVPWEALLRDLQPVAEVGDAVRALHARVAARPYVGVMVRAHARSHELTARMSPVEWFVHRMHEIREVEPDVGFFLSCDVDGVADRIAAAVGDVVRQTDKGAYNSRRALQASVVDLYLLAGSSHILAPHFSSFPELAVSLAGPRLRLETSQTGTDQAFEAGTLGFASDPLTPSASVWTSAAR